MKKTGKITDEANISGYHVPVLLKESMEYLNIIPDGIYVDCTFGGGGHSKAILQQLNNKGTLIAFDQDEQAQRNVPDDERLLFIPHNFRHLKRFLKLHQIKEVNGIFADLGVSSHQFDEAERGFSTRFQSNLDMRMDQRQSTTAADVINTYSELALHKLFEQYGEVTNAKTLAKTIVTARCNGIISTTDQLKQVIEGIIKGNPNKYLAQVFQALRIEVNDELGALKEMLIQSVDCLQKGGRLAVITFHSLEDRVVKNFFKAGSFIEAMDDVFGNRPQSPFRIITKKPVLPAQSEILHNNRARSAKLRVAEKI